MMKKKVIKDVTEYIVTMLFDYNGNNFLDKMDEKKKVMRVLEQDRINIKNAFGVEVESDLFNLIEQFIITKAFKNVVFYSSESLTASKKDEVWEAFSLYIKKEKGDGYIDINYKKKIIWCIEEHNSAITKLLDFKSNLITKKIEENYEESKEKLGKIIKTLAENTKLQKEDDELDFAIKQLEAIMVSYRYDISQLRKIQVLSMLGTVIVLFVLCISVPLSVRYVQEFVTMFLMIVFLIFVTSSELILIYIWHQVSKKMSILEKKVNEMRDDLWKIYCNMLSERLKDKLLGKLYEI